MAEIHEIAPDVFRISVYVKDFDLQFNHFLVRDEEPLLYHAGMRRMFPELREAVARIIDPADLRWISWSHFEVDECGGLNHWLEAAPNAVPACSLVGAMVNLSDFSDRPPKGLTRGEVLETGKYRFRFHPTPHLPHGWDAGVLFEETQGILFCSDLFHQTGEREALMEDASLLERTRDAMAQYEAGPLMAYLPYTPNTSRLLGELAGFNPRTLAIMHGSSYTGDGAAMLRDLGPVLEGIYGG
ncbi:MAG: MBL fold metallo-hydrolase [Verrucomicrobiae bacterium]|nr:MBL fold metallo-hydrolase [Verrucomicrobiae bacterium]